MSLPRLLDILIPRFITEDVAVLAFHRTGCDGPIYHPICAAQDAEPGEVFDGIATMRSFNLFGYGLFARFDMSNVRPWVNPNGKACKP